MGTGIHPIQKHVLKRLAEHKTLRYGQLKPPHVEGNQFTYHLKTLVARKLVSKNGAAYALTTQGVRFTTQVNFEDFFVRIQPKIVTLIVCKNKHGQYLLYNRSKQPFLHMVGFPYGKIHLGEKVEKAAERELKEKTGISASLTQKGIVYLRVNDADDDIITHMLCHIFAGSNPKGDLLEHPPFGSVFWLSERELLKENIMPGVKEVLSIAKRKTASLAFEEYEFQQASQ